MKYKNIKKGEALLIAFCLLLVCTVGGLIAFMSDRTADVTNTFTPAKVVIDVEEQWDSAHSLKEHVKIENTSQSDVAAYIRAMIVVNWSNADESQVYGTLPVLGTDYELQLNLNNSTETGKWHYKDGYFYYDKPVAVGAATSDLIVRCVQKREGPSGYKLNVHILAQGIQAVGVKQYENDQVKKAVVEAWGIDPETNTAWDTYPAQ